MGIDWPLVGVFAVIVAVWGLGLWAEALSEE